MSNKKIGLSMMIMSLLFSLAIAQASEKSIDNSEYQIIPTNPELSAATVSGNLDGTNTFDRVWEDGIDSGCALTTSDSGNDGVSYQVFEFHSPSGQAADIEVSLDTLSDSLLFVYCSFNPAAPMDMVAGVDDDDGVGFGSAISPADGLILVANTSYYAVVTGYGPADLGTFDLILGGDLIFGAFVDTSIIAPSVPDLSTIDLTVPGDTSIVFSNTGGTDGSLDTCSLTSGTAFTITAPATFPASVPAGGDVTVTVTGTVVATDTLNCSYIDSTGTVDVSFTLQGHAIQAPTSVPFIGTWALGLMSLLMLFVGLMVVRIRY